MASNQEAKLSVSEMGRLSNTIDQVVGTTRSHALTLQNQIMDDLMPRFHGDMAGAFVQVHDVIQGELRAVNADMEAMGQQVKTTASTHSANDAVEAANHRRIIGGIPSAINRTA